MDPSPPTFMGVCICQLAGSTQPNVRQTEEALQLKANHCDDGYYRFWTLCRTIETLEGTIRLAVIPIGYMFIFYQ